MSVLVLVRYDVRPFGPAWQVVDRRTGEPASIDGLRAQYLEEKEAAEIADLLNTLEVLRGSPVYH